MLYIAVGLVLFMLGVGLRPCLDRGREAAGRWYRGRRLYPHMVYKCARCHWWWEQGERWEWRGPYWVDTTRASGQCPDPGAGRRRTWAEMEASYPDCVPHLRPSVDRALIRAMGP